MEGQKRGGDDGRESRGELHELHKEREHPPLGITRAVIAGIVHRLVF